MRSVATMAFGIEPYSAEEMVTYEGEAIRKAEEFVERMHGRDHPEFARLVAGQSRIEMEMERSARQQASAALGGIGESSAYAQTGKPVERHAFLTELLGPSIVRKLFGR